MAASELTIINPYTGQPELTLPLMNAAQAEAAVKKARAAFEDWRRTDIAARIALCEGFVKALRTQQNQIANEITRQMGKPKQQSMNEVNGTIDRCLYMMSIAEQTLQDEHLPEKEGFVRYVRHEPLGVVLDIAAWNYPLLIAVNVVVPAVLAGNAVIVKHSSRTPLCGQAFADCFEQAGAPDSLVQNLIADHRVTESLIQHPEIDYVSFTGSVRGGHEVVRSAAGRFIDIGLELGGKDPAYVCGDADFDYAVDNCVDGAFYNAGQSCCAVERIYVERPIYDRFVEAYAEKTRAYRLGDPTDAATTIGPMATPGAREFLAGQLAEAVGAGGKFVVSPDEFETPPAGWFCAPGVVANAPQACRLMQEESFGPVIGILPVDSDDEAVRLMNDSPYGLTASIWTADLDRAVRIGERIETGTFYMNRCDYLDPALPWTGVKDTGRGASLSHYGFHKLTRLKSMHLRTRIPSSS